MRLNAKKLKIKNNNKLIRQLIYVQGKFCFNCKNKLDLDSW